MGPEFESVFTTDIISYYFIGTHEEALNKTGPFRESYIN